MYTVPFFHRGDTEAPQRPQRPQRRKRDAFFQRGHRGRIFFLLMKSAGSSSSLHVAATPLMQALRNPSALVLFYSTLCTAAIGPLQRKTSGPTSQNSGGSWGD